MARHTVEELLYLYDKDRCSLELRGRVWCLCRDGSVITRITKPHIIIEFFDIIKSRKCSSKELIINE